MRTAKRLAARHLDRGPIDKIANGQLSGHGVDYIRCPVRLGSRPPAERGHAFVGRNAQLSASAPSIVEIDKQHVDLLHRLRRLDASSGDLKLGVIDEAAFVKYSQLANGTFAIRSAGTDLPTLDEMSPLPYVRAHAIVLAALLIASGILGGSALAFLCALTTATAAALLHMRYRHDVRVAGVRTPAHRSRLDDVVSNDALAALGPATLLIVISFLTGISPNGTVVHTARIAIGFLTLAAILGAFIGLGEGTKVLAGLILGIFATYISTLGSAVFQGAQPKLLVGDTVLVRPRPRRQWWPPFSKIHPPDLRGRQYVIDVSLEGIHLTPAGPREEAALPEQRFVREADRLALVNHDSARLSQQGFSGCMHRCAGINWYCIENPRCFEAK